MNDSWLFILYLSPILPGITLQLKMMVGVSNCTALDSVQFNLIILLKVNDTNRFPSSRFIDDQAQNELGVDKSRIYST